MTALIFVALPATFIGINAIAEGYVRTVFRSLANAVTIFTATGALVWWFNQDAGSLPQQFSLGRLLLVTTIVSLVLAMITIVVNATVFQ